MMDYRALYELLLKDVLNRQKESNMSVENATLPPNSPSRSHSLPILKNNEDVTRSKEKRLTDEGSLHSYHLWLKEKQLRENDEKKQNVKLEDEEMEDANDDNFHVESVLERGPSPPESESSNAYEWSYEEQFKQLYEIDDDPERKTFLDEYFEFMKGRGTPVSRIPIMAKQILDLFQLYNLVVKHGGLVQVIRNKQWSKITKGLNLPTSITSAAFTLRTQYLKYLYPYECTMHNFSTPKELQAAIDSNRRDRFSSLYHTEPTMTSSRDDRFGSFTLNGCDYTGSQPRHHLPPHPNMNPSQVDMRYGLKRPGEQLPSKPYDKYSLESPKVIVLQDSNPQQMSDGRPDKVTPPAFHPRSRSPIRESEIRTLAEMEAARRRDHHHYGGYPSKDWDGDARHIIEEESRRRLLDESRSRSAGLICKDKNCNGIDCQYNRPDMHRHRGHDSLLPVCACTYCKDYQSRGSYSPPRSRDLPRHHMDGATSANDTRYNHNNSSPPHLDLNGTSHPPPPSRTENNKSENDDLENGGSQLTTLKMKLPDVRQGGNTIQISLEVAGVLYEGKISAKLPPPVTNGHYDVTTNNEAENSENTVIHPRL